MVIHNHSDQDDRLIAAASDVAKRVELHTHIEKDGVVRMTKLKNGMVIPAGGMHAKTARRSYYVYGADAVVGTWRCD